MTRALICLLALVAVACTSNPPPPAPTATAAAYNPSSRPSANPTGTPLSATPAPPTTSPSPTAAPTPPPKTVGDLALEMCDPEGNLPCEHQAVFLSEPIATAGVALTYSTEWADGRLDRPTWNADALGLGGWALDVLQRYDAADSVLLGGDGTWRMVTPVDLPDGQHAIPTYDGFVYYVFDSSWRHVRTVDSVTGVTLLTFTYDDAGRLSGVTGTLGSGPIALTVDRIENGALASVLGLGETRTGLAVDSAGRLDAVYNPDESALSIAYGAFGLVTDWKQTGRGPMTYEYDDAGRVVSATDADSVTRKFAFDSSSDAVTVTTTFATGGSASVRSERVPTDVLRRTFTDSDGTVTVLDANPDGSTLLTEPDGTTTNIGAQTHPRWGMAAPIRTPIVETRPDGSTYRLDTTTTMASGSAEPAGGAWETDYTVNGDRFVDTYDPATRTLTRTDPTGVKSAQEFDDHARLIEVRTPGQADVDFVYDDAGRLASRTVGSGNLAATTKYTYDPNTGEMTETRPDGTTYKSAYDGFGQQLRSTLDGEATSFVRDSSGAVIQVRSGNHPATSIGYSPAGRETAFIPVVVGDDQSYETTTYTTAGEAAAISGPGDRSISISYDAAGRASSWQYDHGSATTQYGQTSGLLDQNATSDGVTTKFSYAGWVPTGLAWSGPVNGTDAQTVDSLLRTTAESVNGTDPIVFSYDGAGFLTAIGSLAFDRDAATGLISHASAGVVEATTEYDANGRPTTITSTAKGKTVSSVAYTYDQLGRITGIDTGPNVVAYAYDATGRLISAQVNAATETYSYDFSGNRVSITRGLAAPIAATYDERDRLVTLGSSTYTYNPDGALLSRADGAAMTTYDFDDFGELRSVGLPDGRKLDYVVDAGGRRIGRMVGGALTDGYLYDTDGNLVAWTDATDKVRAQFAYDDVGHLALVKTGGHELVVITDQIGSPLMLVDAATGDVVESITYDAWGNIESDSHPGLIPIGFAGGLADPDTGFVHFGTRDYDPAAGRWTSPDPLGYRSGDPNPYLYATGDPVNVADPSGLAPCAPAACAGVSAGYALDRPVGGGVPIGRGAGGHKGTGVGGKGGGYHDRGPGGPSHGTQPPSDSKPIPHYSEPPPERNTYNTPFPRPPRNGGHQKFSTCLLICVPQKVGPNDPAGLLPPELGAPGGAYCLGTLCVPYGNGGLCLGLCTSGDKNGNFAYCILACFFGEPHLLTGDGLHVDFQAAGEFIVNRTADGAIEVQARFEVPGSLTNITRTTALAMLVAGDRVAFYADPTRPMIINGTVVDRPEYSTRLPNGGTVERHGAHAFVKWPDGTTLGVDLYAHFVNFGLRPSEAIAASLQGVAGNHDGNVANDLTTSDGTVVSPDDPSFRDLLYHQFADSWRISQDESLFDYLPGQSTATFQRPEIPTAPATVDTLDADTRARAEALCKAAGATSDPALSDCVLDFGLTGDPSYAGSAATVAVSELTMAVPAVPGTSQSIALDTPVSGEIKVGGQVDTYSFTVPAQQLVYLDAQGGCADTTIRWSVRDATGNVVTGDDRHTTDEAICFDLGLYTLRAGTYSIRVRSPETGVGTYGFQIWVVPPATTFTISTNQVVTTGQPASGAGEMTAPGEVDRYVFTLPVAEAVYLDAQGDCGETVIRWHLLAPDGTELTSADALHNEAICFDLGRFNLDPGTYTIEVTSVSAEGIGPYAFKVWEVAHTQVFSITLGQVVSSGQPPGGGEIFTPGQEADYNFALDSPQTILLDALGPCSSTVITWSLLGPDGTVLALPSGGRPIEAICFDLGPFNLDAGSYTIHVTTTDGLGKYSFQVVNPPPPT